MKAVQFHEFGGSDKLVVEDIPVPVTGPQDVLIRVKATGVNPADWKIREGYMKHMHFPFPVIPGFEMAGVVESIGEGVSKFRVGDKVYGSAMQSYATYVAVAEEGLLPIPAHLSFEEAATLSSAKVAWGALFDVAHLQPGHRVVIHGAAGGVGLFAVQLAKWKGAFVVATASGSNAEYLQSIGADEVIDYKTVAFETVIKEADVVFDGVGGDTQTRSWQVLKPGGFLVSIVVPPSAALAKEKGVNAAFATSTTNPEALKTIKQLIAEGKIKPQVRKVFTGLASAAAAQDFSQKGPTGRGKIVIRVEE